MGFGASRLGFEGVGILDLRPGGWGSGIQDLGLQLGGLGFGARTPIPGPGIPGLWALGFGI